MRRLSIRTVTFFAAALAMGIPAAADHVVKSLRLNVETFATRPADGRPARVVFASEPAFAEVSLTVAALPSQEKERTARNLPSSGWFRELVWEFHRAGDAEPARVTAEAVPNPSSEGATASESRLVEPGTRQRVRYRLAGLQPGVYEARVRVAGLESNRERFLVTAGTESSDLRREYARYKTLYRSPDVESLEKHLRELAELDPLNAGPSCYTQSY
jgi:hypothetical protein